MFEKRSIYEAEIEENADHFETPVFVHATDADISSVLTFSLISEIAGSSQTDHHRHSPTNNVNNLDSIDETINEEPVAEDRISDDLKTSDDMMIASASRVLYDRNYDFVEIPVTVNSNIDIGVNAGDFYHRSTVAATEKQFSVDLKTGEIRVLKPVVYSKEPVVLTIKVSDGVHNAKCKVKITVRDTNNNDPVFDHSIYYANVSEVAEIGQFVTKLIAHDADVDLNAQIVYTLLLPSADEMAIDGFQNNNQLNSKLNNDFVINNRTGVIVVNNALDYDRKNVYTYKLKAEDCGVPRRHTITTVIINVLNENNKNPYFKPNTQMTEVNEHTPVSTKIYKLIAEDPDLLVQQQQQHQNKHLFGYPLTLHSSYHHHLNENALKENEMMLNYRIENIVALSKDGGQVEPGSQAWQEVNRFFAIDSNGYLIVINPLRYELAALVTLNLR